MLQVVITGTESGGILADFLSSLVSHASFLTTKSLSVALVFLKILDAFSQFLDLVIHQHPVGEQPTNKYERNGSEVFRSGFTGSCEIRLEDKYLSAMGLVDTERGALSV